jgi:NAD(P)H-hydrate epimerase
MGMGQGDDVQKAVVWLLQHYKGKLLLDADALNVFAQLPTRDQERLLKEKTCDVVMTPHVKEFSRLSGETVQSIIEQGIQAPARFAKDYALTLLLKNAVTCICNEEEVRLQNRGCSGQAKGGSGDVLAGVIIGLAASGLSCFDAACVGSFLCGAAAEKAQEKLGAYAMLPSDVISYLGAAFLSVLH